MKEQTGILIFSITLIIIFIFVIIAMWHPWLNVDKILKSIESDIEEGIPYANLVFVENWVPTGTRIDIYLQPDCDCEPSLKVAYFTINLFGHTDKIYIRLGDEFTEFNVWW